MGTNQDYVSYPIALALKKAGFDWKCRAHYTNDYVNDDPEDVSREVKFHYDWTSPYDYNRIVGNTSAPFIWQAQKWLREKWDWHIDVSPAADCSFDADGQVCEEWNYWAFDVMHVISTRRILESWEQYDSYEAALSAGISAALELIENKGE